MNIVIASDFHLQFHEDAAQRNRSELILRFLRSLCGNTDLLILNGDVFDLWLEWREVIPSGYFRVFEALTELRRTGCRIVMIPGNHDFLFGRFLPDQLGIELCGDTFTETIDGRRLYVAHGDTYTTNDLRYQLYRRVVRSGFARWMIRMLHPDWALAVGMRFSRSSRRMVLPPEALNRKALGLLNKAHSLIGQYDIVVFGHSHIPAFAKIGNGWYLNSGDWLRHRTYVRITDGFPELLEYKE
jgi:UDP-2,3-diacylglucosamine hydrolase